MSWFDNLGVVTHKTLSSVAEATSLCIYTVRSVIINKYERVRTKELLLGVTPLSYLVVVEIENVSCTSMGGE